MSVRTVRTNCVMGPSFVLPPPLESTKAALSFCPGDAHWELSARVRSLQHLAGCRDAIPSAGTDVGGGNGPRGGPARTRLTAWASPDWHASTPLEPMLWALFLRELLACRGLVLVFDGPAPTVAVADRLNLVSLDAITIGHEHCVLSVGVVTAAGNVEEPGGVVNFAVAPKGNVMLDRGAASRWDSMSAIAS